MSATSLITLRLPTSLVERADALLEQLTDSEESVLLGRASRSIVLRLAVLRGIENLEAQVASANKAGAADARSPAAKKKKSVAKRA
jgi:hypothetical protein